MRKSIKHGKLIWLFGKTIFSKSMINENFGIQLRLPLRRKQEVDKYRIKRYWYCSNSSGDRIQVFLFKYAL